MLFKNPGDKLQILILAKQMYRREADFFINQYEETVKRPSGYVRIHLKTSTQGNGRLRINAPPSDEGINQAGFHENIP